MQLFNVTKIFRLVALSSNPSSNRNSVFHVRYTALVTCNNINNGEFLLQDVGIFGGKCHKPESVKFELPYNEYVLD